MSDLKDLKEFELEEESEKTTKTEILEQRVRDEITKEYEDLLGY